MNKILLLGYINMDSPVIESIENAKGKHINDFTYKDIVYHIASESMLFMTGNHYTCDICKCHTNEPVYHIRDDKRFNFHLECLEENRYDYPYYAGKFNLIDYRLENGDIIPTIMTMYNIDKNCTELHKLNGEIIDVPDSDEIIPLIFDRLKENRI